MSREYKHGDTVPNAVLAKRLDELADAVTKADLSPFVMRIPAELDYCPDLVMSQAAEALRKADDKVARIRAEIEELPKAQTHYEAMAGKRGTGSVEIIRVLEIIDKEGAEKAEGNDDTKLHE